MACHLLSSIAALPLEAPFFWLNADLKRYILQRETVLYSLQYNAWLALGWHQISGSSDT
jgi:hypothetical protein